MVLSWRWQLPPGRTSWSVGSPHVPRSPLVRGPAPHRKPMRAVMVGRGAPIAPETLALGPKRCETPPTHHHCRSYPAIDCSSIVSEAPSSSDLSKSLSSNLVSVLHPLSNLDPATIMNAARCFRPIASRFQPSTLPRVVRQYSSSPAYEYIQVSQPKPGVSQGKLSFGCFPTDDDVTP